MANEKIIDFKLITENPQKLNLTEFEFNIDELSSDLNVYKEQDVAVEMEIVSPKDETFKIDAFYFEEYAFNEDMELKAWGEGGRTEKAPCFRIRLNPKTAGVYNYKVTLKIKGELKDTINGSVEIADNDKQSRLASVEPKRRQVFTTPLGKPFAVIGENLSWNNPAKIKTQFGQYTANQMKLLAEHGGNYARIWDYVDTGSRIKKAVHQMNQDSSAMWDYIFESAEECGFYISFCLNPHGEVSTSIDRTFPSSIWCKENGGYIEDAADFFTNKETIEASKTHLRYVIARWGYTESILCWELFNEIDHSDALSKKGMINEVNAWLKDMADYIRAKDPYGHMVASSAGYPIVSFAISDTFDFVYYHLYNYLTLTQAQRLCYSTWRGYNKPVVVGETGIDGPVKTMNNQRIGEDLLELFQGNWAALMGSAAGTGMHWWWEEAETRKGYRSFDGVSKMAKHIPWDDPEMKNVTNETIECFNNRINALGYMGEDYACLWLYDNKLLPPARYERTSFPNERVCVPLKKGDYKVLWMNAETGEYIKEFTASAEGSLTLDIPEWTKDIALIIKPL